MFERIVCFVVAILSLFCVFFSSRQSEIYTGLAYVAKANYVDATFTSASSLNGSDVSISKSGKELVINSISLKEAGDYEVINYEVFNNSASYDLNVDVLVNGVKDYSDEYFTITTSPATSIDSGEVTNGEIRITLNKNTLEDVSIPFNAELKIEAK